MRIAQICTNVMSGSVGSIVRNICDGIKESDNEYLICYGRGKHPNGYNYYKFDNKFDIYGHAVLARVFDSDGLHSKRATKRLINRLKDFKPDVVHIHCLHGYYINYPLLFEYLKNHGIKVVWTMHDCWAYTGHCCYYMFVKCPKWKLKCHNCVQKASYPKSILFDQSAKNFVMKKKYFNLLDDMIIVTPSEWLKEEIEKSFLKHQNIVVINNGIDLNIFKKIQVNKSSICKKYSISENKKIILGVASVWDYRKGYDEFIKLSTFINNDFQIVLVGLTKKQIKKLPKNIIGISRTDNILELVELYNIAYVFFNPTLEDNYPTVNLESIACGTPVVTYGKGGSGEIIKEKRFGQIINFEDFWSIINCLDKKNLFVDKKNMDKNEMVKKYMQIFIDNKKREQINEC